MGYIEYVILLVYETDTSETARAPLAVSTVSAIKTLYGIVAVETSSKSDGVVALVALFASVDEDAVRAIF